MQTCLAWEAACLLYRQISENKDWCLIMGPNIHPAGRVVVCEKIHLLLKKLTGYIPFPENNGALFAYPNRNQAIYHYPFLLINKISLIYQYAKTKN